MNNVDAQFYKDCTERTATFLTREIHPAYGPCDGFGENEECSECLRVLKMWRDGWQHWVAQFDEGCK